MILVDSDILIAHLRGVEAARDWLLDQVDSSGLAISVLTVTEISGGMPSSERTQVWRLLAGLPHEPVTDAIARRAGDLRRGWHRSHGGIGTVDYLIAATALELGYDLATLNVKHYPMIDYLVPAFALA